MTNPAQEAFDARREQLHQADDVVRLPVLDALALHGIAGEIVGAVRESTEACDAALLVSLLVATGNALGRGPHVVVESDQHPAAINAALVGASGRGRKGTAGSRAREIMRHADEGWHGSATWSGFGSGEGVIAELADSSRADERLLVEERELASLLTAAARDGSILSMIIRNAFDGQPLRNRTRNGRLEVTRYHLSVLGHITVEELRRKLTATEMANGFANRFMWVLVNRARLLPEGGLGFGDNESLHWGTLLGKQIISARGLGRLRRSEAAQQRWADLYGQIADSELPGLVGAITNRAEAYVLRLSLLYALLDGVREIDIEHIDAAWALWRYSEDSARIIFGDLTGDPEVDRLVAAVRRAGAGGISVTELNRAEFSHTKAGPIVARAKRYGLVETEEVSTDGRPRTVVRVPAAD